MLSLLPDKPVPEPARAFPALWVKAQLRGNFSGPAGYKNDEDNVSPRGLVCPCHQAELARAKLSILDFGQFLAIDIQRQSLAEQSASRWLVP